MNSIMRLFASVGVGFWLCQSGWAAVMSIDSATFSGNDVTSITVGAVPYGVLTGASPASTVPPAPPRVWNSAGGSDPLTSSVALSGLNATDGVLNADATFQFGRALGLNERLFFMDLDSAGFGDIATIQAVDAADAQIGDYAFTLPSGGGSAGGNSYGPGLLTYTASRSNGADLANFRLHGVSFTLGDLVGTTGDLASATGFRLVDRAGTVTVDPMVAGIAVPEPSAAVTLLGAVALLARWRNRQWT